MGVTIEVATSIWDWVANVVALSDENQEKLEAWRSGVKLPTYSQLEKFSSSTHIPFGYFFLDSPPLETPEILEFRTLDSVALKNPSRDLIDTISLMEDIQDWMHQDAMSLQAGYPLSGQ